MPGLYEYVFGGLFFLFCAIGLFRAERRGVQKMKTIPAMNGIHEGIRRSVEMGRPVIFEFGTIALDKYTQYIGPALGILREIADESARLGAHLICTSSDPPGLVLMEEIVKNAYIFHERSVEELDMRFLATSSFAYTLALLDLMEREPPGCHFLMGTTSFNAVIVCHAAYELGAFQVAGAIQTYQLPVMVATCDYTLLGEEFTVIGSIFGEDLGQLGTIVGHDWAKAFIIGLSIVGVILAQFGISIL